MADKQRGPEARINMSRPQPSGGGPAPPLGTGCSSPRSISEESLARLEHLLEPAGREIVSFLREARHATIEELRQLIGESCHMNVLARIEHDVNRQAELILGGPLLVFEDSRVNPATGERVYASWWLTPEAERALAPGAPRDLPVDVFVEEAAVVVIAQLPGLREEDIQVKAEPERLVLCGDIAGHGRCQEIPLPARVTGARPQVRYNNEVLLVRLERERANDSS